MSALDANTKTIDAFDFKEKAELFDEFVQLAKSQLAKGENKRNGNFIFFRITFQYFWFT